MKSSQLNTVFLAWTSSALDNHRITHNQALSRLLHVFCLPFFPTPPPLLPSSSSPFSFSPLHFSLTFPNPFLSFLPSLFPFLFSPPLCTRWAEVEGFFYSVASLLHVVPADMTEQFVDLLCQKISAGANHENGLFKLKLWVGEKKNVCLDRKF